MLNKIIASMLLTFVGSTACAQVCNDTLVALPPTPVYHGAHPCPDEENPQWWCAEFVDILPPRSACAQENYETEMECFHYITLVVWRYTVNCTEDGSCWTDWNTQRLGGWIKDYKLCPCGSGGCQLLPGSRREGDALARAVRARAEGDPLAGRFVAKRNPRPAALNGARLHGPAIEVASLGLDATKPRSDLEVCT